MHHDNVQAFPEPFSMTIVIRSRLHISYKDARDLSNSNLAVSAHLMLLQA